MVNILFTSCIAPNHTQQHTEDHGGHIDPPATRHRTTCSEITTMLLTSFGLPRFKMDDGKNTKNVQLKIMRNSIV